MDETVCPGLPTPYLPNSKRRGPRQSAVSRGHVAAFTGKKPWRLGCSRREQVRRILAPGAQIHTMQERHSRWH